MAASVTISGSIGGVSISGTMTRLGATPIGVSPDDPLDAGNAGTLTTRTDNNTGVFTATSSDHDIVNGNKVDVFWDGGSRYGMTVTGVSGTAITIDLGAGTNLPVLTTAMVVDKQVVFDVDAAGADVVMAMAATQRRGLCVFYKADDTVLAHQDIGISGNDGEPWLVYVSDAGMTNPFAADDIGYMTFSNGSSEGSSIVSAGILLDNET
jgi:hypothetical protein